MAKMLCMAAVSAVLLALLAPTIAARSLSATELESAKEQCKVTAPASGAFSKLECEDCVQALLGANKPYWACSSNQLCQAEEDLWEIQSAFDFGCTECLEDNEPQTCLSCVKNVPSMDGTALSDADNWSTEQENVVADARNYCLLCNSAGSTFDAAAQYPQYPGKLPGFQTASAGQGKEAEYRDACSKCANLPNTEAGDKARMQCAYCMSSTFAMPRSQPGGYMSADEIAQLEVDKGAPLGPLDYPLTDFGKCAYLANHTYNVEVNRVAPTGIYSTCAWEASDFPLVPKPAGTIDADFQLPECIDCISATIDNSSKAYACGLCRNPDWVNNDAEESDDCIACVTNPNVTEAWGCTNCFDLYRDAGDARDSCVGCATSSPYQGKVGAYNWACGACAELEEVNPLVADLCFQCITRPADDSRSAGTLEDDLLNHSWIGNASEIICSCVDMAKLSTWGDNAPGALEDWYIYECPNCTAQQKECYMRRNITWPSGIMPDPRPAYLVGPETGAEFPEGYTEYFDLCDGAPYNAADLDEEFAEIINAILSDTCFGEHDVGADLVNVVTAINNECLNPGSVINCTIAERSAVIKPYVLYHLDDFVINPENTGELCATCMRNFTQRLDIDDIAYACNAYCANPYTMKSEGQINQCYEYLEKKATTEAPGAGNDVAGVEMCIQAFNGHYPPYAEEWFEYDLTRREVCMECLLWPTEFEHNRDWACVACGQLYGPGRDACYECLEENVLDPCMCVDGGKRDWLCYEETTICVTTNQTDLDDFLAANQPDVEVLGGAVNMSVFFDGLYNDRSCAQLAYSHGAELFAVFGDDEEMCYVMLGNEQYLKDVGFNVSNDPNITTDCTVPVYSTGHCTADPGEGPVTVGGPCSCPRLETPSNVDILCFRDEDLGSAGGCLVEALSPWQRRCVCSDPDMVYVEFVGCVMYGELISDALVTAETTNSQGRKAMCLQGKKLSMCLNDIGTLGSFANVASANPAFSKAVAGMSEGKASSGKLMAAYAKTGLFSDTETCDFFVAGDERVGWTLTAMKPDGTGGTILVKDKNNRYVSGSNMGQATRLGTVLIESIPSPSYPDGKIIKYTSTAPSDVGYELTVTMPDANADSVYMAMTITNKLVDDLTDLAFVWVQDADQGRCSSSNTYDSIYYVENDRPPSSVNQVIAYEIANRRPVVALTSCTSGRAGTVAQNTADEDLKFADYFATQLPNMTAGTQFPPNTFSPPTVMGNLAMYMLFEEDLLPAGETVTFEWTMSFYPVGGIPTAR